MLTFPKLITGAAAQYGSSKEVRFYCQVLRYLDGTEQRITQRPSQVRWHLQYEQLTVVEVRLLADFFVQARGAAGGFEFEDPWSGDLSGGCFLDNDEIEFEWTTTGQARTTIVIRKAGVHP